MTAAPRRAWIQFVPPPVLFATALALGELVGRLSGPARLSASTRDLVFAVGAGLTGAGTALVFACIGRFAAARTTILPHGAPVRLITTGAYRLSRNPMYLGMGCLHLGVAAMRGNPWSAALVVAPLAVLQAIVIPGEERRLADTFGDAYAAYRAKVRRWF